MTDEQLQASVERLTQQRKGGGLITSSARDFNDWKRKHRVSSGTKVSSVDTREFGLDEFVQEPRSFNMCCSRCSLGFAAFFILLQRGVRSDRMENQHPTVV